MRTVILAIGTVILCFGAPALAYQSKEASCQAESQMAQIALMQRTSGVPKFDVLKILLQGHDDQEGVAGQLGAYEVYRAANWGYSLRQETFKSTDNSKLADLYKKMCIKDFGDEGHSE